MLRYAVYQEYFSYVFKFFWLRVPLSDEVKEAKAKGLDAPLLLF